MFVNGAYPQICHCNIGTMEFPKFSTTSGNSGGFSYGFPKDSVNVGGFFSHHHPKAIAEAEAEVAYGAPGDLPELWREATTSMAAAQKEQAGWSSESGTKMYQMVN